MSETLLMQCNGVIVCGVISRSHGRPCTASPMPGSLTCWIHSSKILERQRKQTGIKPATVLAEMIMSALSPEDAAIVAEIYEYGPCTLEDQIALVRLRIGDLERKYRDGYLLLADYHKHLRSLSETLRKLVESNSKIALNQSLQERFDAAPGEMFNPFLALPQPTGDNEDA